MLIGYFLTILGINAIFCFIRTSNRQVVGMGKNNTSFKVGYDAKRFVPVNNGLVEYHTRLGELLREQSLDAVSFLVNTMNNDKASLKLRVTAAHTILDRGLGKPVDRVVLASVDSGGSVDPATLDTAELERIISKLDDKEGIIDGEFTESL
jgi:hypothetical protein